MRALFDRIKQKYVATLNRLPQMGGHFSLPHTSVAHAESSGVATAAAGSTAGNATTVRTSGTAHSGHLSH
jgi:hypothetical protein